VVRRTWFAEFRHQKQNSCQTLFAGVEKLIDKISLVRILRVSRTSKIDRRTYAPRASRGSSPSVLSLTRYSGIAWQSQSQSAHACERFFANEISEGEKRDGASFPPAETTVSFARPF